MGLRLPPGEHVDSKDLADNLTYSWIWCPLIGHAMGRGYLSSQPPLSPSSNAWVTAVRGLITNSQIPGPWGTLVPPWESLLDGRGATHVRADFQDAVQLALQGQGPDAI